MTQPFFPCTISAQSRNNEFLTIRSVVRKTHQNNGHTGSSCLDKAVLAQGAMRQRKLGSHTPPCHRRIVITTLFSVFLAALQRRPVLYHTRWLLTVLWLRSSGH